MKVIELALLSPCVSVREYRGSAQRARGLKNRGVNKKKVIIPGSFLSLLRRINEKV
ncbi:hypothetical protein [Barnesiella intestinihominis]|uniref:hypothetical protein n=1 Tax=Barnesiella intestinihominis TaxID=487174 RepID=UPI00398453BC